MVEECVLKFAKAKRVSAWGSGVFDKNSPEFEVRAQLVSPLGDFERGKCAACWGVRMLHRRLVLKEHPPYGCLPIEPLVVDALVDRTGQTWSIRESCMLCLDCARNGKLFPLASAPLDSAEVVGAMQKIVSRNEPPSTATRSPVKSRAAPAFDGMSIEIDDRVAAELLFTPHRPGAKPIGEKFNILIRPPLGRLALVRVVGADWRAIDERGERLELDDLREPALRNIAFGACDLLAAQKECSPHQLYVDDGKPLPVKLIKPTHRIRVHVGIDLREQAIQVLEGEKTFEVVTSEAIFVRGHWVNQRCGAGGAERKHIWRRPHFRGRGSKSGRAYEMVVPCV
jgi:hypothetical protein